MEHHDKQTPLKLVLVEWLDSHYVAGWHFDAPITEPKVCHSVGWLIYEGPKAITIAGHLADNGEQRSGEMTIPAGVIVKVKKLR